MTILFKGIPFCTRPETGILEGVMLPAIVRNDTGSFENGKKKWLPFQEATFSSPDPNQVLILNQILIFNDV
jgi:hypothetical protein